MIMEEQNYAILTLDRPFFDRKTEIHLPVGTCLKEFLPTAVDKPGLAYVVLVNGRVSDVEYCVERGDVIICLPQIAGG